jgi:hypothetical protein
MSEVKSFKTVGGDEIVSEVISLVYEGEKIVKYKLRRPQVLQFQPVAPGKMGLAFVPWLLSNPELDSVEVPVTVLPFCFPTATEVERQYLTQMSGIQIAGAGSIS